MNHHSTNTLPSGAVVHRWRPDGVPTGIVVLQHGFGEYAERYLDLHHGLIGELLIRNLEVLAPDLWGHGRSPGRRGLTHVGRAVDDHREVLRTAGGSGVPIVAVGHSLGALVTAASVFSSPPVAGVVLLSAALPFPLPALGRRLIGLAARALPTVPIPERRQPLAGLTRSADVLARTVTDPKMFTGQVSLLMAATALDVVADVRARAPRVETPCLVLHGTADTYTAPEGSRQLAELLGSRAELHLIEGARHELLNDDPERVLKLILNFLQRVRRSHRS